jgi:hypothetical protein
VAVLVATLGWWCVPRFPTNPDECWQLLVVRRVRAGRQLYRGVFFGAGPWSVWVARLVVGWWGERLMVLRRLVVVLSVAVGAAAWAWTAAVGVPWPVGLAVAAGTMLLSTALWTVDNHYGLWSRLGVLVALAAPLAVDDPVAAGVAGGLGLAIALLNKYTLGLVSLPGVVAVGVQQGSPSTVLLELCLGGVLALAGYALAARGGVGPAMVQRLLRNKRTFVQTAGSGFFAGWRAMVGRPHVRSVLEWRVSLVAFALTALSAGLVLVDAVVATVRGGGSDTTPAVLGLALVAIAALWPRADEVHVRSSLTLWTVPAVASADRLAPALGVGWALLVAGAGLVSAGLAVHERRRGWPDTPEGTPFEGMNAWPWDIAEVTAGGEELRRLTRGRVFLLRPDASVWYLATGLRNPTPYDYPLASTFGPNGQQVLSANLASGQVRFCCWAPSHAGRLAPTHLEEYAASLPVVAHTRAWTLVTAV